MGGYDVTGFDISAPAIAIAHALRLQSQEQASESGLQMDSLQKRRRTGGKCHFFVASVFELDFDFSQGAPFDTILDSALFHCIGGEEARQIYVKIIERLIRPGGRL